MGVRSICTALAILIAPPAASAGDDKVIKARDILKHHCGRCHGGPSQGASADKGGFAHVLNLKRLTTDGQVVPFKPDKSELYTRIRDGEMPPTGDHQRPSPEELQALHLWISEGAKAAPAPRRFFGPTLIDSRVEQDLARHPNSVRRHLRYVSLAHLANAGHSRARLAIAREGVTKAMNSLSWAKDIALPVGVDPLDLILRVDLRDLGWSHERWELIARRNPYGLARTTVNAATVRRWTQTMVPIIRADWLVASAPVPPLFPNEALMFSA